MKFLALAAACTALLLPACGGTASTPETHKAVPKLQPGGCGLSYDWLPADKVGAVVSSSELVSEQKKSSTIDTLMDFIHYSALTPVKYGSDAYLDTSLKDIREEFGIVLV